MALLSTATAPQLVLDLTPNGHGPRLVDHLLGLNLVGCALRVGGASVVPPGPAAARRAPDTFFLGLAPIRCRKDGAHLYVYIAGYHYRLVRGVSIFRLVRRVSYRRGNFAGQHLRHFTF